VRATRFKRDAQRHARAQQMLLAHNLAQAARAQAFGQGLMGSSSVHDRQGQAIRRW
jgi:hypothetical protein